MDPLVIAGVFELTASLVGIFRRYNMADPVEREAALQAAETELAGRFDAQALRLAAEAARRAALPPAQIVIATLHTD